MPPMSASNSGATTSDSTMDETTTTTTSTNNMELSSPNTVREWIAQNHPKQLTLLDKFEMQLRLGRLSTTPTAQSSSSSSETNNNNNNNNPYGNTDRRLITSRTVELLRTLIGQTKWKNAAQLLTLLRGIGMELHAAGGYKEPVIGNVVRRIMCAVRIEAMNSIDGGDNDRNVGKEKKSKKGMSRGMEDIDENLAQSFKKNVNVGSSSNVTGGGGDKAREGGGSGLSLSSMLWAHPQHFSSSTGSSNLHANSTRLRSDSFSSVDSNSRSTSLNDANTAAKTMRFPSAFYVQRPDFRQAVMEAIQEIMLDLEDVHKNINDQASSHIHAGEIIFTYGRSKTVELFLKAAAKKRKFQVIVSEGAPHFGGHAMAKSLAHANIDTTVIHDSAIFTIMARVNKVLLPSHAVLANGGLIAPSGSHMIALAAEHNSVPLVSLTGLFKLCPMFPHEGQDTLQDLASPSAVVDYSELSDGLMDQVELVNPVHDYVPPQLINLYVTNIGAFQPSYTYRLLAEYYHSDDMETFE